MRHALRLAGRALGVVAPNPAVGCVIVSREGHVIGRGWTGQGGRPHAETIALAEAGAAALGATAYVALEPCSHHGQTPPCASALMEAGVARVVAAVEDPDPRVRGKGFAALRDADIELVTGVCAKQAAELNAGFFKRVREGRPLVTLKIAQSLDGKTATATGESKWITGEAARAYGHLLRARNDAILIGIGTAMADDPQLTCRLSRGGRDPLRVVVDSRLRTPPDARIFHLQSTAITVIATVAQDEGRFAAYRERGAELLSCRDAGGRVDLADLLGQLGKRGVQSVLVESGGELAGALLRQGLIDRLVLFYGAKLVGGEGRSPFAGSGVEKMSQAIRLQEMQVRRFGDDLMVSGYLR